MDPLAIYSKISNLRVGLTATASVTSTVTTLAGNVNVSSNLSIAGEVSNNVFGALSMRAYDDTGIYSAASLSAGTTLPPPFTTRPIMEQQVSSLNLTSALFGTISANYSLKINGYVQPPATGTYIFKATYRDGLSMYVASQKLIDSWIYQGTMQQAVGTLTMYSNVWAAFALEHTAGTSERLLIEWANPGGTYVTMNSSNFTFAYDMKEVPQSLIGSSYFYGRTNFADTANLIKGAYLPNATAFTGYTSELTNDASFIKNGATSLNITGTVSAAALAFTGTTSGTVLQLVNALATVSGTVTTTAYGAFGVTPGTALERYALTSHRWWTGSSGTNSGTVGMQLSSGGLSLSTLSTSADIIVGGLARQPNAYSVSLRGSGASLSVNGTTPVNISTYFPTQANMFPSAAAWLIGSTITIPKTGIYMASTYVYTVPSAPVNNSFEVYLMSLSLNGTNVAAMGQQTSFGQGIYLPLQGSFYAAAGAGLGFSIQTIDATETIQFLNSTLFQLSLIVPM